MLAKVNLPGLGRSPERLLAPGSEPLGELRYTWAEGLVVSSVLSVQVESAVTLTLRQEGIQLMPPDAP